jgi:hypothetical protein
MRQGQQHRRGRGRNNISHHPGNRKGQNPLTRSYESNGPDVKVRGTPAHVAEKYMQLARDAQASGDHVLAENYLQHAEHYNRIILAYREQQTQHSGEAMNGHSRHHHTDEGPGDDDLGADDMGSDQPVLTRHPGEQPRTDMQPSFDEPRPQPQHGSRHDQHPRFRERHMRGERHDRQDGFERNARQERQDRHGDRGFDRHRERPYRQSEQPGEGRDMQPGREPREPREMREPREVREPREMREPREPREPREHRHPPHDAPRDIPRDAAPPSVPPELPPAEAETPPPARAEGTPRRRERFGLGADQPEFLRRPVRRPRREVEQEFAPESPAPSLPPADEPPRE